MVAHGTVTALGTGCRCEACAATLAKMRKPKVMRRRVRAVPPKPNLFAKTDESDKGRLRDMLGTAYDADYYHLRQEYLGSALTLAS